MTRQIQSAQQPIALEDLGRRTHFSHEDAEALLNIYGMLLGPGTFEEKAGPLCEAVAALAEVERVTIRLADEEVQGLRLVATGGSGIAELMATPVIPYGQGLAGKAFQDGLPVVAADYSSPPAADPTLKDIGQYSVIVWPIKAAGRTTGSLLVGTRKLDHFTPQRIGLLTSILERLGPALENVQLREERLRTEEASLHKMQELAAMFKVANILVQPGSVQEKITDIMRELAEIAEAAWAIYRVPDEKQGGLRWVDLVGSDIVRVTPLLPYGHNIPSIAFHQREAVVANDYASHPLAKRAILDLGVEAFLSVPVMADGATFGVISVAAGHSGHFTEERVKLLTAIIDGLATLLVNSKLTQDLQSSRAEMAVVDEVARIVTSTLKMDEVYQRFASEIGGLMEADQARIGTVDEDNGTLTLTYTSLDAWSPNLVGETIPLAGTFTENIAQSRESLIVDDLKAETRFWTVKGLVQDGMRSSIIVPMVSKDRLIGTLIILSSQPKAYGPREQAILERLALQMAPAVENAQQLQKNQQLALALESIGDGVAFLDNASQVQFVNRSWTNLYGYELNEVRGKHISFVMTDYQGLQDFSADTTKENVIPVWEGEVKRKKKNGEEFDVFLTLTPVTDQSGRVIGRIGISKDITEIKRTAASAKSSLQELEVVDEVAHIVTTTLEIDEVYEQFASELKKTD